MTTHAYDPLLAQLAQDPEMIRCTYEPGQVLLYEGHHPQGFFIVLSGALRVKPGPQCRASVSPLDASSGPFIIPAENELEGDSRYEVSALTHVEALLLPRSALERHPVLKGTLMSQGLLQFHCCDPEL
jgi:hypothetical protein